MSKSQLPSLRQIRNAHSWKRRYEKYLPLSRFFYRPIGFFLTWIAIRLGLSTEAVSWLSGAVGISGLLCLMGKSFGLIWLGIGLLAFFNILDCVDGSIARVMKTENPYGKFLDSVLGDVIDFAFYPVIGIMVYRHSTLMAFSFQSDAGATFYLIIGGITGFFYILLLHIEHLYHSQIKKTKSVGNKNFPSNEIETFKSALNAEGKHNINSVSKTALRLIDRNFRVRETHYLFLFFALLLKCVDFFLLVFFTYYFLHILVTSMIYFYRAKIMRDCEFRSRVT